MCNITQSWTVSQIYGSFVHSLASYLRVGAAVGYGEVGAEGAYG